MGSAFNFHSYGVTHQQWHYLLHAVDKKQKANKSVSSAHGLSLSGAITEHKHSEGYISASFEYWPWCPVPYNIL